MRDKAESFRTKILRRTVEVKVSAVKGSKVLGVGAPPTLAGSRVRAPQGPGSEPLRVQGQSPSGGQGQRPSRSNYRMFTRDKAELIIYGTSYISSCYFVGLY